MMMRMGRFRLPIIGLVLLFLLARGVIARSVDVSAVLALGGVVIIIALVALVVSWNGRRERRRIQAERIEDLKDELQRRLDEIANNILRLESETTASGDKTALRYFRDASIAYASILNDLEGAGNTRELRRLATRLEAATWNLDAAEAILNGSPAPPRPDPTRLLTTTERRRAAEPDIAAAIGVVSDFIEGRRHVSHGDHSHSRRRSRRSRHC